MRNVTIKEKTVKVKGTHKYSIKSLSTHFLSRIILLCWLKHQRRFGWRHTSMLLFRLVHFAGFSSTKTTPLTASPICYNEELKCWFFCIITWVLLKAQDSLTWCWHSLSHHCLTITPSLSLVLVFFFLRRRIFPSTFPFASSHLS